MKVLQRYITLNRRPDDIVYVGVLQMGILQHIESASLFYVKESEIILTDLISRESGPRISHFSY